MGCLKKRAWLSSHFSSDHYTIDHIDTHTHRASWLEHLEDPTKLLPCLLPLFVSPGDAFSEPLQVFLKWETNKTAQTTRVTPLAYYYYYYPMLCHYIALPVGSVWSWLCRPGQTSRLWTRWRLRPQWSPRLSPSPAARWAASARAFSSRRTGRKQEMEAPPRILLEGRHLLRMWG